MPVRSLNSSVFTWPNRNQVDRAVRAWAAEEAKKHPKLLRLGYFGSYARGDWGVGSDLDLVAVVVSSDVPFTSRSLVWNFDPLPVPAEILVYTLDEWNKLVSGGGRFIRTVERETVWVVSELGDTGGLM